MPENERFVAILRGPYGGEPSRHYVGVPPTGSGDRDTRERIAVPLVLVLERRPDGIFLDRFNDLGDEAGDTWHESIDDAKAQAVAEYGDHVGSWTEVPANEDPVAFALRLANIGA